MNATCLRQTTRRTHGIVWFTLWAAMMLSVASGSLAAVAGPEQSTALATKALAHLASVAREDAAVSRDDRFEIFNVITDEKRDHVRMNRRYKGLRVIGGDLVVHMDKAGVYRGVSTTMLRPIRLGIKPIVNSDAARRLALSDALARGHGPLMAGLTELVVFAPRHAHPLVVWEVELTAQGWSHNRVAYIGARTGALVYQSPEANFAFVPAIGNTLYSGTVDLRAKKNGPTDFDLRNDTTGKHWVTQGDLRMPLPVSSETSTFGDSTASNPNSVAADAMYGHDQAWRFYGAVFGLNGFDGQGESGESVVHAFKSGEILERAAWHHKSRTVRYSEPGLGETASVSLDIAAHEWTHAVSGLTFNLRSRSGESSAVHEFIADSMAVAIDHWTNNPVSPPNWDLGEQISGWPYRRVWLPSDDGFSYDCWFSWIDYVNVDAHDIAGIGNHFFYILSEGTGPGRTKLCRNGDQRTANRIAADFPGLGIEKAQTILFNSLSYMTSMGNFHDMRNATLQYAMLYDGGTRSPEFLHTKRAWDAVNVNDVVFFSFFDKIPPEIVGVGVYLVPVQGYFGVGFLEDSRRQVNEFAGSFLQLCNRGKFTVNLKDLPPHNFLNLDFLLAAIDSLDGDPPTPGGDYLSIKVDGFGVFQESFANARLTQHQSYNPPQEAILKRREDLGFSRGEDYLDSAYYTGFDPSFQDFPHTASTATIEVAFVSDFYQPCNDESFAFENFRVEASKFSRR